MNKEYSDFLAHYGVKGQKWGIRRFQNPDGTLIHPKGKKKKPVPESDTWKKSEAKHLSDDELNRRNNRMQREFQYKQNIDNRHPARKEIAAMAKKIFVGTAVAVAAGAITLRYKSALAKGAGFISRLASKGKNRIALRSIMKNSQSGGALKYMSNRAHGARRYI